MSLTEKIIKTLLPLFLAAVFFTGCDKSLLVGMDDLPADSEERIEIKEVVPPGAIPGNITIDLSEVAGAGEKLNIHGMTKEEARDKIGSLYSFSLKVINGNPDIEGFIELSLSADSISGNSAPEKKTEEGAEESPEEEETASAEDGQSEQDPGAEASEVDMPSGNDIDLQEYSLPDIVGQSADILLNEIYEEHLSDDEDATADYTLTLPREEYADTFSSMLHDAWSLEPGTNVLSSYDPESGEFLFGGAHDGYEIDAEKLKESLLNSLDKREFEGEIVAEGISTSVSSDELKNLYKILASFETHTTNVAVRNKNVSLAADAINGHIVMPGEEFSYNGTVGKRTKEKGYGEAGAYNNGEVVQEIGGGVCQVSTTLYNAVFRAGLKSTERTSHTFSPSYVTPGCDATVSWGGPDYKFVNNSDYPIGIKAHYESRKVYVSIYGVPLLDEGITLDLESHKTATLPVPAPRIVATGKGDSGSAGSIWEAYKVTYKDGEEINREFDHKSKYVGHTPVIVQNPMLPPGMTEEEFNALLMQQAMQQQALQQQQAAGQ